MESLKNHFLIAMPSMNDPYFSRSVTYICEHDENGAMGLIINQPISQLSVSQLLKKMELDNHDSQDNELSRPVYHGGPVSPERGFVLHKSQMPWSSSIQISDQLSITTSKDILQVLGTEATPEQYLITLGYAGWTAGQLEEEIKANSWLTIEADLEILFDTDPGERWEKATKKLGFDIWQLTSQAGHS